MTPASRVESGPRVLELFGPSSAGKSTLAARLCAGEGGPGFALLFDRVLADVGLGFLRPRWLRVLALDAVAFATVVTTWRAWRPFYAAAAAEALRSAGPLHWPMRFNLLRNTWKRAALRLRAERHGRAGETLVMDEGPLQSVHYLFVHVDPPPALERLDAFLRAIPLPDAALYVDDADEALVARTLARGHPRLPQGSEPEAARWVRHARIVFERIRAEPRVRERLVTREALLACGARDRASGERA
jgi:hypothetical protein